MAQRDIARSKIVVLPDQGDIVAEGVTVLYADKDSSLAHPFYSVCVIWCKSDFSLGRVGLDGLVNCLERSDRLFFGVTVALGRPRSLPDVDREKDRIQAAFGHSRKIDFGAGYVRIVA